ncbi:MAG: hypothetical protein ACYS76_16850 [Planctomycetota bacterium]|jgi:hypothetical protein
MFTKIANIPSLKMYRKDAHGDDVTIGNIIFVGIDDAAQPSEYAQIAAYADDDAAGAEVGRLDFNLSGGGSITKRWSIATDEFYGTTGGALLLHGSARRRMG